MKREAVKNSSNILSVGHDPLTNKMHIEFRNGKVFEYDEVDASQHSTLMKADSIGSHFSKHIRTNHKCNCVSK